VSTLPTSESPVPAAPVAAPPAADAIAVSRAAPALAKSAAPTWAKYCCQCGDDVTTQPRMKDRQGRYWCIPCGEADAVSRNQELTHCSACGKEFQRGQLLIHDGALACEECVKSGAVAAAVKAVRQPRPKGDATPSARKIYIFLATVVVLVIVYLLFRK
jgi:hypothetical protein